MLLPECLIWAMDNNGRCTGVKIYCEENIREIIASRFTELYNEEYKALLDLVEEEYGKCVEKGSSYNPFYGAHVSDYGVYLPFEELSIFYSEDYPSDHDAGEAIEKALETIKREYPSIRYEGYVGYVVSDPHSGWVCQYEISSQEVEDSDIVYDFVGEELAFALIFDFTWDSLYDRLDGADENEFKKIIKVFHAYSQWLPPDSIDRLIALSEEIDENMKESLEKFAEALRAGEDVEIEEKSEYESWQPPDGYMEALDMFTMAGEISGNTLNFNEPVSSDEAFQLVIEKAESGDAKAKFTAGKYFIADHMEEETERAIRWIREAAEAGIEEAKEYMDEHSEMFKSA